MNRALELLKGKQEVGPNVFMWSDEILSITMDPDLTVEQKKGLFSGKYKSKQQILRDKAKRIEEECSVTTSSGNKTDVDKLITMVLEGSQR